MIATAHCLLLPAHLYDFQRNQTQGAYIIDFEPIEDERGFFARTFCRDEFEKYELNPRFVQSNISYNRQKGTLRGMHYQLAPYGEVKAHYLLERIVYDVIIDLRPDSPTYNNGWHLNLALIVEN